YWHKGCFSCEVCKMTLNMKNYKGFEKRPYCNASPLKVKAYGCCGKVLPFLPLLSGEGGVSTKEIPKVPLQ
ncbi:hypothetical protein CRENBAI_017474, partial [Crenichthys baileyi]